MKKGFRFYSLLFMVLTVLSCKEQEKRRSQEFAVEIRSGRLGTKFEAFMYNTNLTTYTKNRYDINKGTLDRNTLYILKHHFKDTVEVVDTFKVKLQESAVDSLYKLTYDYLSTVNMSNEIETEDNKVKEVIADGASFTVSLIYNQKRLEGSQWGLKGIFRASEQGERLFVFLNRKLPEEFMLY